MYHMMYHFGSCWMPNRVDQKYKYERVRIYQDILVYANPKLLLHRGRKSMVRRNNMCKQRKPPVGHRLQMERVEAAGSWQMKPPSMASYVKWYLSTTSAARRHWYSPLLNYVSRRSCHFSSIRFSRANLVEANAGPLCLSQVAQKLQHNGKR